MYMKKNLFLIFIVLLLSVSCSSTKKIISTSDYSPIALISVTGNQTLPWYKEVDEKNFSETDGTGVLSTLVNKLIDANNPEYLSYQDRLDYSEESFHHILSDLGAGSVVDKNVLLESTVYSKISEGLLKDFNSDLASTGLKKLDGIGGKNARLLMEEVGAKSIIIADFKFTKKLLKGHKRTGMLAAHGEMSIKFYDSRGKQLTTEDYMSTSLIQLPIEKGEYDKNALVDSFPEVIDNLIGQFAMAHMTE